MTITFADKVVSINQADVDMEEYGAGAKLYNEESYLEFNYYSKGKENSATVSVQELCEKGQVSIWNSGDNLLGSSSYPNDLVVKDCSQANKIVLKIAADRQILITPSWPVPKIKLL